MVMTTPSTQDRALLKNWVMRASIVPGVWGSGLDQLLQALRATITERGTDGFPAAAIDTMMAARGKSLAASEELIEAILDYEFGDGETFGVLAITFPHVNTRNIHHVDHIVPRAKLSRAALRAAGMDEEEAVTLSALRDGLPNLELLEGPENVAKNARMPLSWARDVFPTSAQYSAYLDRHALPELIDDPADFREFYEERRVLLRDRIRRAFGHHTPARASRHEATTGEATTGEVEGIPPLEESMETAGAALQEE